MGAARARWLTEGVRVLAEEGAAGIRIDRIAARLELSKGSFHHHFAGAAGYKRDLLAHIEELLTTPLQSVSTELAGTDGREVLRRLTELVDSPGDLYRPELETAFRAWALGDPDAARVQARVDEQRLEVLRGVWRGLSGDAEEVRLAALLPYLIMLGASVLVPPTPPEDLRLLFERILELVPENAD